MSDLRYIFVHGLSGWGSYDPAYQRMPYWGMRGGDLIPFLREKGYDSYAASVAPAGSAWDRAGWTTEWRTAESTATNGSAGIIPLAR